MRENTLDNLDHIVFVALVQMKGIGYHTLYNYLKSNKKLSLLLETETLNEFNSLLGRNIDSNILDGDSWSSFLEKFKQLGVEQLRILEEKDIKLALHTDSFFPNISPDIEKPIYWLFIQGNIENLFGHFSMALIGSRDNSSLGTFVTESILFGIANAKEKIVTISGLANGIDQLVHEISLFLEIPTIAILGNGLFHNYPENSINLRNRILESGGTILSEYFPDTKPTKDSFVHRNRIQAALADVVIPLEWKIKSGTAHTIKFAHQMNKKIVCVETPICKKLFLDQASANKDAQQRYGAPIFIMPNQINELIKYLNLTILNENSKMISSFEQMDLGL